MSTEQTKSISENAISRLMGALERGQSEALKNYLRVVSRFHRYFPPKAKTADAGQQPELLEQAAPGAGA